MAKKISTYVVAAGCIQEGSEVFIKGQAYTPPTAALEKELLELGVIAVPEDQSSAALAQVEAEAAAKAQAEAEEAKAKEEAEAAAKAQAEAEEAKAKEEAEAAAKAQADLLNQGQ
jgi:hypothetical protein